MAEFFYSETEKILFNVAGYTDNSSNVEEIKKVLDNGVNELCELSKVKFDRKNVRTDFIRTSSRYKYMRVFYIEDIEDELIPKEAFRLGKDWTMRKWLEN